MNDSRLSRQQIAETIGRLPAFQGLPPETLLQLAGATRQVRLPRDGELFNKGDAAEAAYIVVGGQIKVYLPLSEGVEKVVSMAEPGECIGVAAAYLGAPHATCAISKADCHLLAIEGEALRRQACIEARLACRLLDVVSRRVVGLLHDLESCTPRSSLQRVCCFLLQQRPTPEAMRYEIVLPTSKREIAAKLNLAQETLSRTLHQLIADRIIEVSGRLIRVLDNERLAAINLNGCPQH
jgi:CRP-like cAMP-binding protein